MRKMKNIIIYVIVCIVILATFKIPEILLEIEEHNIGIAVYEKEKNERTIDIEAEKIYLVKAIHDIEDENSSVKISSKELEQKYLFESTNNETVDLEQENLLGSINNETVDINVNMYSELLKLNEYNILKIIEIDENNKIEIDLTEIKYKIENDEYSINNVLLKLDNKEFKLEIENKTGKILNIVVEKDYLYSDNKEEIMKNYVEYLDLHIIDDWKFEENMVSSEKYHWKFANNMLKSEKAGLAVNLVEDENTYILSIHSLERISNTFVEYVVK